MYYWIILDFFGKKKKKVKTCQLFSATTTTKESSCTGLGEIDKQMDKQVAFLPAWVGYRAPAVHVCAQIHSTPTPPSLCSAYPWRVTKGDHLCIRLRNVPRGQVQHVSRSDISVTYFYSIFAPSDVSGGFWVVMHFIWTQLLIILRSLGLFVASYPCPSSGTHHERPY